MNYHELKLTRLNQQTLGTKERGLVDKQPVINLQPIDLRMSPHLDEISARRSVFDRESSGEKLPIIETIVEVFFRTAEAKGFRPLLPDICRHSNKGVTSREVEFSEEIFIKRIVERLENVISNHEINTASIDELFRLIKEIWVSELTKPAGPIPSNVILNINWMDLSTAHASKITELVEYQNCCRPFLSIKLRRQLELYL